MVFSCCDSLVEFICLRRIGIISAHAKNPHHLLGSYQFSSIQSVQPLTLSQRVLVLIAISQHQLAKGEKEQTVGKTNCTIVGWETIQKMKGFECTNADKYCIEQMSTVVSGDIQMCPHESVHWFKVSRFFFIISSTIHFGPASIHCMSHRTTCNEAVLLWVCTQHVPTKLTYSDSVCSLKTELAFNV